MWKNYFSRLLNVHNVSDVKQIEVHMAEPLVPDPSGLQEKISRKLGSGDACYYSVQNLLCPSLLFKNIKIRICRTIILPVVLYRYETWSLTLREEHRLRVFENRVLRRVFGPKRGEMMGEWKKLHNEELRDL
jgi:hypothetical protein